MRNSQIHPDLRNALALLGDIPADATTAQACWDAVRPKCPAGKTYARWSFWGVLNTAVIVRRKRIDLVIEYIHNWHHRESNAACAWPPKALFVPVAPVPLPWTGVSEKPGAAVPWDGKK